MSWPQLEFGSSIKRAGRSGAYFKLNMSRLTSSAPSFCPLPCGYQFQLSNWTICRYFLKSTWPETKLSPFHRQVSNFSSFWQMHSYTLNLCFYFLLLMIKHFWELKMIFALPIQTALSNRPKAKMSHQINHPSLSTTQRKNKDIGTLF